MQSLEITKVCVGGKTPLLSVWLYRVVCFGESSFFTLSSLAQMIGLHSQMAIQALVTRNDQIGMYSDNQDSIPMTGSHG